ncbi:MAG TPA: hypothetical protein VJJ23_05850 [Candidatus Nanoarchaeia archaeon]|nr:hypothetical protein [Candidatus Nanoarchaeia archaeon]
MKILTIVVLLLIFTSIARAEKVTGYFSISQEIKIEDIIQDSNAIEFNVISEQQLPELEVYLTYNDNKVTPKLIKTAKNTNTYSYEFENIPSKVTININYSDKETKEDVQLLNLSPKRENSIISFFKTLFSKLFK